jgi:AAA family ATP:ADP antiporter
MQPSPANPQSASLLARLLQRVASVEPGEIALLVAAFLLFFFMWGGYFAVRPIRETIGTILGRDQVAHLWVYTLIFSLLVIPLYGVIVAHVRRAIFLPAIYGVVAAVLFAVGIAMRGAVINPALGKFFYVFISVVNLFLISVFWSFLLELFTTTQAKRLFGVIAAGGSAGALLGPFVVSELLLGRIGNSGVLFFGAALFVVAIVCQRTLLSLWSGPSEASAAAGQQDRPLGGNMFAGVPLLLRSPYLLGIALFVVGISTVNTLLYFEQLRLVEIYFPDPTERTRVFARLDWIVQALTMVSQLLITGQIARRFGVIALVTGVPVAMVIGFLALAAGFVAYPLPAEGVAAAAAPASFAVFWIFAAVFVFRRASEYAFVRPGREMLWSPLDKETKYKAKNTVDVPVYRFADWLSAQVSNGVSASGAGATGVALLGVGVAVLWAMLGWWLGRRHDSVTTAVLEQRTQRDVAPVA